MHLLAALVTLAAIASFTSGEVIVSFVTVEWDWNRTQYDRNTSLANGEWVPGLGSLTGLAVDVTGYKIWVTSPRGSAPRGVPSALSMVAFNSDGDPVLVPYPDWQHNEVGNCDALQCAMGMTLDHRTGLLYVVDVGATGFFGPNPLRSCPPKLVVYDTYNGGAVRRTYTLPSDVIDPNANWLNDVVLDYVDPSDPSSEPWYAYMPDSWGTKLICLDLKTGDSWFYTHASMLSEPDAVNITINGEVFPSPGVINGIAMSPSFNYIYYSAVAGYNLYQVPTWVLRSKNSAEVFASNVRSVGKKISNSDAILFGRRNLYYGAIGETAVYYWDIQADMQKQGANEGEVTLETEVAVNENSFSLIWPDGLAFDRFGYFYYVSSKANMMGRYDLSGASGANNRIQRQYVNDAHYLDINPEYGYPWAPYSSRPRGYY